MSKKTTEIGLKWQKTKRGFRHAVTAKIPWVLIGTATAFACFIWISKFYDENRVVFDTPVRFYTPIKVVKRKPAEVIIRSPVVASTETADQAKEKLAERVYQYVRYLESEIGFNGDPDATHSYCQSIGKINEIGYFPNGNRKYCFSTEAKQKEGFMYEYHDRMKKGYTMREFLCEWVSGKKQPMCQRTIDMGL